MTKARIAMTGRARSGSGWLTGVWCGLVLMTVSVARAQLAVRVQPERDTFLLYESIPVVVDIRNNSGRTLELADNGDQPWLIIAVTDESGSLISNLGKLETGPSASVPPGRILSQTVDLLPFFDLRARGTYRVKAQINAGGQQAASLPATFTIVHGREIWVQTVGLPPEEGRAPESRTYSLQARRGPQSDHLYVMVKDDARDLIYGMLPLGVFLPLGDPQVRTDRAGHLHVLYPAAPRSVQYWEIDPEGKVAQRAVYSDLLSRPALVSSPDGVVTVQGGEKTYPRTERMLSDKELAPPPPPPPPKKHWWWPFGPGKRPAAATNVTSRAASGRATEPTE